MAAIPALPAWQHGQYAIIASMGAGYAIIVSTAAIPAWHLCCIASMAPMQGGSYASKAAMPARQLCQQGSYASMAAFLALTVKPSLSAH